MVDFEPGSRIRKLLDMDGDRVQAVVGQNGSGGFEIPDRPGPAIAGRTPVVGEFRRKRDMPVIRDRIGTVLD